MYLEKAQFPNKPKLFVRLLKELLQDEPMFDEVHIGTKFLPPDYPQSESQIIIEVSESITTNSGFTQEVLIELLVYSISETKVEQLCDYLETNLDGLSEFDSIYWVEIDAGATKLVQADDGLAEMRVIELQALISLES